VGDVAVAGKIDEIMEEHRRRPGSTPLFIFVITMENHGPLHLEKVRAGDVEQLYTTHPPAGCEDLTVYLRHLCNADRMIGLIREGLERTQRAAWLCFFGDHLPIMAKVYQELGHPVPDSEYVLWSNCGDGSVQQADMRVEDLAGLILQQAGLGGGSESEAHSSFDSSARV
jgi:phosphoglycerol transferase MdoB-like AlkP superfamily enzyme